MLVYSQDIDFYYFSILDQRWELEYAPILAKKVNAQVIAIDWGFNELSCCSYPLLLFCHMNQISQWMTQILKECSTIGNSTSAENTWLIGHSVASQLMGQISQNLLKIHHLKVEKLIGLDPSGILFANKNTDGKCHGIQKGSANQTIIFFTNPEGLGTNDLALADVNILCNKKKNFCQIGCDCDDSICNHSYAANNLFGVLVQEIPLKATFSNNNRNETAYISIYEHMKAGSYDLDTDGNYELQNSLGKNRKNEL